MQSLMLVQSALVMSEADLSLSSASCFPQETYQCMLELSPIMTTYARIFHCLRLVSCLRVPISVTACP